ncbi:MAG: hypothetical protein ABIP94_24820 [Planctomycetota bacterium]
MAIAVLLKFLLSPLMRSLKQRIGMPIALSAALLVGGMLAGLSLLTVSIVPAAMHWTEEVTMGFLWGVAGLLLAVPVLMPRRSLASTFPRGGRCKSCSKAGRRSAAPIQRIFAC